MTATATIDEERLVSQPDRGVIFLARRDELRLTKVPRYPIRGASGQQVGESEGERIVFREGRCYVPPDGEDFTLEDGRTIDAREVREWLERHRLLGDVNEGFWKVETTAPPVSRDEMQRLLNAAMALDEDTLRAIVEQERAGWDRGDVIEPATNALERIQAMKAEAQAKPAAKKPAAKAQE